MKAKRSAQIIKLQPPLRCAVPTPGDMEFEEDDIARATRSGMWQSRVTRASARRTKRAKAQPALSAVSAFETVGGFRLGRIPGSS
jgi:hypothetical protein